MAYQYEAGFIGAGNMGGALARAAVKTVGGGGGGRGLLHGGALRKGGGIHRLRCGDGRSDPAGEPIRVLGSEAPDGLPV